MNLAPLALVPGIRSHSGLPGIIKYPCRQTGIVASLCGRILCRTASRFAGSLLVIGAFLFQGRGQINQNRVVVSALLVPLSGILVVCVQVYHIGYVGQAGRWTQQGSGCFGHGPETGTPQ